MRIGSDEPSPYPIFAFPCRFPLTPYPFEIYRTPHSSGDLGRSKLSLDTETGALYGPGFD